MQHYGYQYTSLILIQQPIIIPAGIPPPPPSNSPHVRRTSTRIRLYPLTVASGLFLNFSVFLISRNFSSVTYFLSLHFRHAIRSSEYFVRLSFSFFVFLRDPVGNISGSQASVVTYYDNQPDNVTSLTLHSTVR